MGPGIMVIMVMVITAAVVAAKDFNEGCEESYHESLGKRSSSLIDLKDQHFGFTPRDWATLGHYGKRINLSQVRALAYLIITWHPRNPLAPFFYSDFVIRISCCCFIQFHYLSHMLAEWP
jgi:hypothetical protein